jgi:predicted amidohydrolase
LFFHSPFLKRREKYMPGAFDVLLKNGIVVDYASNREEQADVGIKDGKIVEIASGLDARGASEIFDLNGLYVMPGIIDLHTHISPWLGGKWGHKMLAQAGVTTAFDFSGPAKEVRKLAKEYGTGLNIASIEYVQPGQTVPDENPSAKDIESLIDKAMSQGSLGIKLLGGHYPLTSEATARAIEIANQKGAYVAFHCGTLVKGSNLEGFSEAAELAGSNALHIAHVNSYARGIIKDYMEEAEEILKTLTSKPNLTSESYLSPLNGTSGKCINGEPASGVTRKCLNIGGFEATEAGMEKAINEGWAQVNMPAGGEIILSVGKDGVDYWRALGTDAGVSFLANPPEARLRLATAKKPSGEFVVDCISTDGGGIPRNVILEMGLSLVKLQTLTLKEFVLKTSYNPSKILGLKNKGRLSPGADADITVFDFDRQKAYMSLVQGGVIMYRGHVCGKSSRFITTEAGRKNIEEMETVTVDLSESLFYQRLQKQ